MHKIFFFLLLIISFSLSAIERKEGESDADYKKRYLKSIGVAETPSEESAPEQTPDQAPAQTPGQAPEQVANNQAAPNNESLEDSVDQTVEDLAQMGGMQKNGETLEYKEDKVEPVKIKDSYLTKMMDSQTKALLGTMMAKSPFADMSKESIEQVFIARNEGNPLGSFLKNNEKPRKILVDFLKHEKALPNIVSVINKPEKIKYMGIFAAVVLGLAFLANLMNSKGGIVKRVLKKFAIGVLAGLFNLGFFIFLFHEEMKPTINIFLKYYHV